MTMNWGRKRGSKANRMIALLVAFFMLLGCVGDFIQPAFGSVLDIDRVIIEAVLDEYKLARIIVYVEVSGTPGTYPVSYTRSGVPVNLGNVVIPPGAEVGFGFAQFTLTGNALQHAEGMIDIRVGNRTAETRFQDMPTITDPQTNVIVEVPAGLTGGAIIFRGDNFNLLSQSAFEMIIERTTGTWTKEIHDTPSPTIKNMNVTGLIRETGTTGSQHVVFQKQQVINGTEIGVFKRYENAFRLVDRLSYEDLRFTPRRGVAGSFLYITTKSPGGFQDHDISFLESTLDTFRANNTVKHANISYSEDRGLMRVRIPNTLAANKNYMVYLTNPITQPTGDFTNQVTRLQRAGETRDGAGNVTSVDRFFVVEADVAPIITEISPSSGPNNGQEVRIIGYNFEELNYIEGFENLVVTPSLIREISTVNRPVTTDVIPGSELNPSGPNIEKLSIAYQPIVINDRTFNVEKHISVFFGGLDASIVEDKVLLTNTGDLKDFITVRTRNTTRTDTVDVMMILETIIKEGDNEVRSNYIIVREKAYTLLPSYIAPTIEEVIPNKIQVQPTNSVWETKEDMVIGIRGSNFKVYRYRVGNNEVANYPLVYISDDIILKRVGNDVLKRNGNVFVPLPGATLEVINPQGLEVNGTIGNQTGNYILITLPKGQEVSSLGPQKVAVSNPVLNTLDHGNVPTERPQAVDFVLGTNNPSITNVTPRATTVDSGVEIAVTGINFAPGVRVFLGGREIPQGNIRRIVSADGIGVELRFNALRRPLAKVGYTRLMVMNPTGEIATSDFTYVTTLGQDPRITSFSPDRGTHGSKIVVDGVNFAKPNPGILDIQGRAIYRLIGSIIKLDGRDVNDYVLDPRGNPMLEDYTSPNGNPILSATDNTVNLADYYQGVILREGPLNNPINFYVLNVDRSGRITLTDGGGSAEGQLVKQYEISAIGDELRAQMGNDIYQIAVYNNRITLTKTSGTPHHFELNLMTVFRTDSSNNIIGRRVQVIDSNRLIVTVPLLQPKQMPDGYRVTVENPDTVSHTATQLFHYLIPQSQPSITNVTPNSGSVDGGYRVIIRGSGFERTSRVFINGVLVPAAQTTVNTVGTEIEVTVPRYTGNLQRWALEQRESETVPVQVVSEDGGNSILVNGFTYTIPRSNPRIDRLSVNTGSAAGGEIVIIEGYDFRYFEPFDTVQKASTWINGTRDGEAIFFNDLNGNGEWDRFNNHVDYIRDFANKLEPISPPVGVFEHYIYDPIIPRVFFGAQEARVVEFRAGNIKVITPPGQAGAVDVYLINNDTGISNRVRFTYQASNPIIRSISPEVGRKEGRDRLEIIGSGFAASEMWIYQEDSNNPALVTKNRVNMPVVRFGDITNRNIPINGTNSGSIHSGFAEINLPGDLKVVYEANQVSGEITATVSVREDGVTYTRTYPYDNTVAFIPLSQLQVANGTDRYPGYELIRLEYVNGRLFVDRGFSPEVQLVNQGHLRVNTPSYHTIGRVPVVITNPDGGRAQGHFEYKNPNSRPEIINITREGREPVQETIDGYGDVRVVKLTHKGGNIVSVIGTDFRANAKIEIMLSTGKITINPAQITYMLPSRLTFTMPAVPESEVGKLSRVVVINNDGGTAESDKLNPPIYLMFIKGETAPAITNLTPDRGPASGGTRVKIEGNDFRAGLSVFFGEVMVPARDVTVVDYKTIYVTAPPNLPGTVDVRVENPDGELSNPSGKYTYISSPTISALVDPTDPNESRRVSRVSVEGGQEVKLKGSGYMQGGRVVFAPVVKAVQPNTPVPNNAIYISGQPYILESGTPGTDFKYIDDETITIKTPRSRLETRGVIVINPDGGASNVFDDIEFNLPELEPPTNVLAELVFERYIRIQWSAVNGATEYEIFAIEGNNNAVFVGSTQLTSFIYQDLKPNTDYRFVIRAVGNFGSSRPSIETNTVRTGRVVGPPDDDGRLNEHTQMTKSGNVANVTIGFRDLDREVTVDLTRGALAGAREVVISIPARVITNNRARDIQVIGADFTLRFNPQTFNNARMRDNSNRDDAGVRFKVAPDTGNINLPGGNNLSSAYILEALSFVGRDSVSMDQILSAMELVMDFDTGKAQMRRLEKVELNRFNSANSSWQPTIYAARTGSSAVQAYVDRLGRYMIIGNRR